METLLATQDYRTWLKATLCALRKRHPARTGRALAMRLDIDPAHLSRVLQGKRHLAVRHIPGLAEFLELNPESTRILETLVLYQTATTPALSHKYFVALQEMRGAHHRTLSDDSHAYFSQWIHPVMRTLLSLVEFRGTSWRRLASLFRAPVTPEEAQASVELLLRLKLIAPDARGILRAMPGTLTSGEAWISEAVRKFQKDTLLLSAELFDRIPKEERDVSTLTIPSSHARLGELRDKIRHFRQELMAWARDLPEEDCVMQLNLQLFPVADASLAQRHRAHGAAE
ncbi:MAG: hypothetical protein RL318_14 [Fibrobacterota bacterium]|jgi:uncharacterized protein (TIGR02147 family)